MLRALQRLIAVARDLCLRDFVALVLTAFVVFALEGLGRSITSEFADGILVVVLACFIGILIAVHRARSIRWVSAVTRLLRRIAPGRNWLDLQIGVDLRGTPPIQRQLPDLFWKPGLFLGIAAAVLCVAAPFMPMALRDGIAPYAYTPYLLLLGSLWSALVGGIVLFGGLSLCLLHDEFVRSSLRPLHRSVRREIGAYIGLVALGLLGAMTLPGWVPFLLAFTVLGLPALWLQTVPAHRSVSFLWRRPRAGGPVRSLRWQDSLTIESVLSLTLILALGAASRGTELIGLRDGSVAEAMPITSVLGLLFLWTAALSGCVVGFVVYRAVRLQRAFGRARATPYVARLTHPSWRKRRRLRRTLAKAGVRCVSARRRARTADLTILSSKDDSSTTSDPFASLDLALCASRRITVPRKADGSLDAVQLGRLAVRSQRRRILCALRLCFRLASRHSFKNGSGSWVGLQHWFAPGITRDASDSTQDLRKDTLIDDSIGVRFSRIAHPEARAHLRDVLHAADVGLVFVEDGVPFLGVERVFETLFELHDIHAGQRVAEDRNFVGIPGVRVVLHEFDMDHPFRSELYPEPDYEDIGRGRILHVFLDRSDELEYLDLPVDSERFSPSQPG